MLHKLMVIKVYYKSRIFFKRMAYGNFHKAALNIMLFYLLSNIIYQNKQRNITHMKKAITNFPNQ